MSKGLIFFCCSCAILLFTVINLSVGPIISGTVEIFDTNWGILNCKKAKDDYDSAKDAGASGDTLKYGPEWSLHDCENKKGMHDMEYTSFIFNMAIGFVCGLLGLLHLFDVKKELISKTGMIGLICGFVGFVFSFIYVVLNGLVYTNYYNIYGTSHFKRDSELAFTELKGDNFECLYYDSQENYHTLMAKYSDLIQKQYNYDKDLVESYSKISSSCKKNPKTLCRQYDGIIPKSDFLNCDNLYVPDYGANLGITNKDISGRFLTTLLLSLFTCLANIGLVILGFLLYRTPGEF